MSNFNILFTPLAGSTFINYFKVLKQGHFTKKHRFKVFMTTLIVILSTPFHIWEWLYFKIRLSGYKMKKPPLFILGHWRSGTTLLHNMMCAAPDAGYLTTYQSVFANNMASQLIYKTFMRILTPERRPSDNIKLDVDYPQEDEFAFCNMNPNGYYNFFTYPLNYDRFYKRSVHFEGLTENEIKTWYSDYDLMLKKAIINTKGNRLIIKNPVNTGRIKQLLKLYPDAKFLYIYRNPITVFLSTHRFFVSLMPTLYFHDVDNDFIDNMIFDIYKRIMNDYLEQKSLIPEKNLLEIRYEDFEKQPVEYMKNIYNDLLDEDFEKIRHYFSDYFSSVKEHKKNKYEIDASIIERIKKEFGKYMEIYNYEVPEEIVIKN